MSTQNSRRGFLKHVATGAALLSMGRSTIRAAAAEKEPCVYLNDADIVEIREKIKKYPWAAKLYKRLTTDVQHPDLARLTYAGATVQRNKALLYRISGDERMVPDLAKEFLRAAAVQAYDLLRNHKLISPHRERIEKRFSEGVKGLKRFLAESKRLTNTRVLRVGPLAILGFLLHDQEAIEMAINGKFGFKKAIDQLQDRMFWPESAGYGMGYVASNLVLIAEAALKSGYGNLYDYVSPSGSSLKSMFDGWIKLGYADGWVATGGDAGQSVSHLKGTGYDNKYEIAYRVYRDPVYAWILSQTPDRDTFDRTLFGYSALTHGVPLGETTPPDAKSSVFPEYGCAMVRSEETPAYWKSNLPAVFIRTGSPQGHGHHDHFGIVLNAFQKNLYADWFIGWDYNGNRYGPKYSRNLLAHNTVMVDRAEPDGCGGGPDELYSRRAPERRDKDTVFEPVRRQGEMQVLVLKGAIYEGVRQERRLGLTKEYVLDVFELTSEKEHTYDYLLHGFGELRVEEVPGMVPYDGFSKEYGLGKIDPRARRPNNVWLRPGLKGVADADWKASFKEGDGIGSEVTVLGCKGTEVFVTDTPYDVSGGGWDATPPDGMTRTIPFLIVRRKGKSATFVVVHQPFADAPSGLSVKRTGTKLTISGQKYVDSIDIASISFARVTRS